MTGEVLGSRSLEALRMTLHEMSDRNPDTYRLLGQTP